ncbi:MAG: Hsp20/alpha crystallin family protein [Prosthecobacter sp.]|jgi:HSP20 family protein|uniref:Hsp20/alpha crystallin family protein n=1 Tax=Prosthecobacter sp. TaxID=1965333 RepID=UPI0019EAC10E|nr:Hsp20/alpha crystallin family protein [Prosthecobacter sp.]MBE2284312.1 Hsp20/alpha crystallin family protein [Prosthecobacter sp.]
MKLIRSTPSSLGRVSDFDEWFRHPFAGLPSLGQFFNNLSEVFPGVPGDRLAVDVHEDKDNYYASFEVPGVKKDDVKIELNNGLLTVSAEKREKNGDNESSFSLTRSVSVPDGVSADGIAAKLEDGILNVTLPKAENRKPRTIALS